MSRSARGPYRNSGFGAKAHTLPEKILLITIQASATAQRFGCDEDSPLQGR